MVEVIWTTLRLAGVTTLLLLLVATPLAWWLSQRQSWWKEIISTLCSLSLVLPPTVIGFYLLIALSPGSPLMAPLHFLGIQSLAFTFSGLVIGSMVYCLPFALQPLRNAFEAIGDAPMEAAAALRAGPVDRFFTVACPLVRSAFPVAAILVFSHTIGEFGVVLMLGGGIPGKTEVMSIRIFNLVEAMHFGAAQTLAAGLLVFGFICLLGLRLFERRFADPVK